MGELSIYFGLDLSRHPRPHKLFDLFYKPSWFDSDLSREMLAVVDGCRYNGEYSIQSPVLGNISPFMLSGGLKNLLLLFNNPSTDYLVDLAFMGQNCMYYIYRILEYHDLRMTCNTYENTMTGLPVRGICENDNSRFNSGDEFMDKLFYWLDKRPERNIPEGYHEGEGLYFWR